MLISAHKITKFHNDKCIFKDVSFSIEEREKIAVIGVNGTGKSTLLKVIAGHEHYEGEAMFQAKEAAISYLSQDPIFNEDISIFQQVKNSIAKHKVEEFQVVSMLSQLKLSDIEQPMGILSGGQKKRVALAIALLTPCELLILDEPTNHLDSDMIEWLENYLVKWKKALLMVTHDRYFLDRITNTIYEIDRTCLYKYAANYSRFLELKQQREENDASLQRKRSAFLKKELEWVRAGVRARGTKSKERMARFETLSEVEKTKGQDSVKMINVNARLGKKTIAWEGLGMRFADSVLFEDFSYTMKRHDRIGVLGTNGCGKSTLLNIIAKTLIPTQGCVEYGETVRIGYFHQGCESMDETQRVIDYIKDVSDDVSTNEGHFSARVMLERFLFDSSLQYAKIAQLSGGEKRRLYLLKVLMQGPNILLLDEPTNDLDIETLTILEDYLDSFSGALIAISHDRYFLDRICDSLFVFKGGVVTSQIGGYSVYLQGREESVAKERTGAQLYAQQKRESKEKRGYFSSKEKQELQGMELCILNLEERVAHIDALMNEAANDFEKISTLSQQREAFVQEIEEKNERWMLLLEMEEESQNNK